MRGTIAENQHIALSDALVSIRIPWRRLVTTQITPHPHPWISDAVGLSSESLKQLNNVPRHLMKWEHQSCKSGQQWSIKTRIWKMNTQSISVLPGVRDSRTGVPDIFNTQRATDGRETGRLGCTSSNSPSMHFHIQVDVPKPLFQIILSPTQLKIYHHTNIMCPSKTAHNKQSRAFVIYKKQAKDCNLVKSILPILMSLFW